MSETLTPPDALLLMGKQCPYCPTVLKGLQSLEADGVIGHLETVVIEDNPEIAAELGVRSVPWVRIGPFELPGLRAEEELREWAEKAGSVSGMAHYLEELIGSGGIDKCLELIKADSNQLDALIQLFTDPDTELNIRIGISAIMESLQGSAALDGISDKLRALLRNKSAHIRGDACYYLSLTGHADAGTWIKPLLDDTDANVRTIAADCLEELAASD